MLRRVGHPRATKKGHYVFEHILVMEDKIDRLMKPGEIVHHINGNKKDNKIKNLELTTQSEHMKHHPAKNPFKKGDKFNILHRKRIAKAKKKWWKEWKAKQK